MTSAIVCELRGVSKSYRGRTVIADLSLAVGRGEMVALTGRSGAGKSTVLNMIGLLEQPDSGTLTLFERKAPQIGSRRGRQLLRRELGYLFQNYALIDGDTVSANLAVAQAFSGLTRRRRRDARAEALARVGLTGFEDRRVFELSGGEQQRLAIARLLLKPCELVLADEPTGSLDAENRDRVLSLLAQLRADGKSVVIVTHDPSVAQACDRVISLERD